jgi:hypothetical protein
MMAFQLAARPPSTMAPSKTWRYPHRKPPQAPPVVRARAGKRVVREQQLDMQGQQVVDVLESRSDINDSIVVREVPDVDTLPPQLRGARCLYLGPAPGK